MKTPPKNLDRSSEQPGNGRPVRPAIQVFVWIICLACAGILAIHQMRSGTREQTKSRSSETSAVRSPVSQSGAAGQSSASGKFAPVSGGGARLSVLFGKPTAASRELVDMLVYLNSTNRLTGVEAAEWRENLRRLIAQGDQAIPAINEFLEKNKDVVFAPEDAQALGYTSARMALLDVLANIASPESSRAMGAVLSSTGSPQEIALVTDFLEQSSPGLYLQAAFDAAQRVLTGVASGNLPDVDTALLFQVFQRYEYGNGYTVPVLKDSANRWNYYAAMALAQLPEEAGVPALRQIADGQEGSSPAARLTALQALSSMTSQSQQAQDALLDLARMNCLSANEWGALVQYLAGNQLIFSRSALGNPVEGVNPADLRSFYVGSSQQTYWTAPLGASTADQISRQKKFIDLMLAATGDPVAVKALKQAQATLDNRLVLLANSSRN